jgi:hypothetical protein
MTTNQTLGGAHRPGKQQCTHWPCCPGTLAYDRTAARIIASHPEQGWNLLCNGVVIFDDGGELLPDGQAFPPAQGRAHLPSTAAA